MQNFNFSAWREQGNPDECRTSRAIVGCVLVLLILWTLLGNLTVCAAVIRYSHLRGKVTNIFIVSLALSDLLVGVLVMPWKATTEVAGFWPFGAFCDTWVACDIMCSTASILNLCVISVDRYWAISSPFIYERTMNRTVAFVMIGVTWSLSAVISFVPVQLNWHRASASDLTNEPEYKLMHPNRTIAAGENCDSSLNRTYAISSSLISFYIPVAIMIVVYTRIYRIAQVQISKISSLERAAEHAQSCRSGEHNQGLSIYHAHRLQQDQPLPQNNQSHRALKLSFKKETKVLKTLSIIMGVFVCCWFPFFVLNCVMPFCSGPESSDKQGPYCVSEKTFDVFVWFGWSNSSLNPIIYAFNAEFRDAFLRLLGCRGGYCCVTVSTPMETAVFSNEARSFKHDSSLNAETGIACTVSRSARGSGDSVNTMIMPLFFHITTSDTEEYMHVVTQSTL